MRSLTTLTALIYFTTTKMKSLPALTTQFYFTSIKMKKSLYVQYAVSLHYY